MRIGIAGFLRRHDGGWECCVCGGEVEFGGVEGCEGLGLSFGCGDEMKEGVCLRV